MAHSSRSRTDQNQLPEFYFDMIMEERNHSFDVVRKIITKIVDDGAEILHNKYLQSQKVPYASRTLATELVMNAAWALAPLDDTEVVAEADEDLTMPPIDEWAGGVLPVRDAEATGLRTAVNPVTDVKKPPLTSRRQIRQNDSTKAINEVKPPNEPNSARTRSTRIPREASTVSAKVKKVRPPPTEAETIMRTFEEVRKKSNVTMKAVTVDADFNVIQIQEPHGLPPSLIVPRIAAKKIVKAEKSQAMISRAPRPSIKKPEPVKKKTAPKLIEQDMPRFDNEIAEVTFADKIVCAPGVTFRDGNAVKSRPPQNNANQLTRIQYEEYLEEMKRKADMT